MIDHLLDVEADGGLVAIGHELLDLEINVDEVVEKFPGQIPVDDLKKGLIQLQNFGST